MVVSASDGTTGKGRELRMRRMRRLLRLSCLNSVGLWPISTSEHGGTQPALGKP